MEKKKFVFQLDTPYTAVSWPEITSENQDTILELLCSLLSPIGHHRLQYVKPSNGKRSTKRKRKEAARVEPEPVSPPAPDIGSFVDVGLSSVTRSLQSNVADAAKESNTSREGGTGDISKSAQSDSPYSIILVARSGQPSILNNHLPQMVGFASRANSSEEPIRLVGISKACQDRLSETLGLPRVSVIGLRKNAPNSKALVEFARQHVPVIDIAWVKEARVAAFKDTKINTIETVIGIQKKKGKPEH